MRTKYEALAPVLNERTRRLWAAAEAEAVGRGGIAMVARATGMSRTRIARGIEELRSDDPLDGGRTRRAGGGRKRTVDTDPTLVSDLNALLEPITAGEPDDSPLRWTSKSVSKLTAELQALGHAVGRRVVNELLHHLGYTLQANRKSTEGTQHPDRDAQFNYLNEQVRSAQQQGHPVISVDTKKKELVGEFKNGGREWRAKGDPEQVKVHDFVIPEQGKAIPYGVYDLSRDEGWVSVGGRSRHRSLRRERDPQLVEPHGPLSLRRYRPRGDHRRCRRQQQSENPAVEVGVAALRESHGAVDHGLPLSAGHQQVEPHRASAVLPTSP